DEALTHAETTDRGFPPWKVRLTAGLGSWVLRLWAGTLSFRHRALGADVDPHRLGLPGHFIYALWHEYLLLPVCFYARADVHVLVSRHADAHLIAEVCRRLRIPVVRGS